MNTRIIVSSIACLFTAGFTQASLLLQENFNSLNTGDLNGQNGWSAVSQLDVATGGLSYSNGDISINGGANHAVWSNANTQPTGSKEFASQSGDVWFSLTLNVSATNNSNRFWFYVSNDAMLTNSGVMGQINSDSTALLAGYRPGSSQFTSSGTSLSVGNTLFLVGRFSKTGISSPSTNYNRMEMWVNPNSTTLGTGSNYFNAVNATGTTISSGIDTFALTALGGGSTVLWDNLLVGTTQFDVLDVYAIPEPSTVVMFGLGAFGLLIARSRRRILNR